MKAGTDVPLVGRDGVVDAVGQRLRRAAAGAREAILFEGEAGIGKTRLIQECIAESAKDGFTVIQGSADDVEQARPFGVLLKAFESCAPELADRLGPLPTDPSDRWLATVDALVSILDEATRSAPVAVILDDLHWADTDTLRALRALVRRTASMPFALIAACRPAQSNPELEALIDSVSYDGLHVDVAPLDEEAVSTLVTTISEGTLSSELRSRVASAHGNPFFVIEIVSSGVEGTDGAEIPKSLRRTVLRGVMQLSDETRSLLRVASLLGATIDPEELAVVTGRSVLDLSDSLAEAVKAHVLEDRDGSLVFRHELVREAVYTDMPIAVRKKLHRDAAHEFAASGAPARLVAAHLGAGAESGDSEAVSWMRRAAAEEKQRSPTLAADMLGHAIDLITPTDSMLEHVQAERVQALVWAGRVSEASRLATEVLTSLRDATLVADLRVGLGQALFFQGRIQEAGVHFRAASHDAPETERGLILAEGSLDMLLSGQIKGAASLARRSLAAAESTQDPRAMSLASAVRGACLLAEGDAAALDLIRDAVQIADDDFLGEAHHYGSPAILGFALAETDLFRDSAAALRRGIELDQKHGITWALPVYHGLLGLQHFLSGEWDDSVAELETLKGLHDDMDSTLFGPLAHGVLANIAVHRDDLSRAEAEIQWAEEQLAERGPQEGVEYVMNARILLAEARGDLATAFAVAKMACQLAEGMGLFLAFRYFAPTLAKLAKANGVPEEARSAVEAAESYAKRSGIRSAVGNALLGRGLLEQDTNLLLEAVATLRESPRPLELATAREAAGLALAEARQNDRATEELNEAIAVYEGLGARLDVARAGEALGAIGGKRKRVRPARPVTGWDSLSPTELRVAALVAEGLSNAAVAERLVVSRRTVETHVYHVFQKLGVSSRAALAARAAANEAVPADVQ